MEIYVVYEIIDDEKVLIQAFDDEDAAADFCDKWDEHSNSFVTYIPLEFIES